MFFLYPEAKPGFPYSHQTYLGRESSRINTNQNQFACFAFIRG
jgi:hypothetical protein